MKKIRPSWIVLTIVSSLLLSAGFVSAAERLDPQLKDLAVREIKTGDTVPTQVPCVVPCADDFR